MDETIDTTSLSGEDLFLKHFMPADADEKKPSGRGDADTTETEETTETKTTEEDSTSQEDQGESEAEESEETAEDAKGAPKYLDEENEGLFVKIKVDGEEREFAVKDLKRLAGQEASLTRKSQEVAQTRKQLDEVATVHTTGLEKLLERARTRFEPYAKLDFFEVASKLDAESLKALRDEAKARYEDVQFLESELSEVGNTIKKARHDDLIVAAKECVKVLSDPHSGIEGWGAKLYGDLRTFATEQGIPQEAINTLVDPSSFKILHMAMLYAKGKSAVQKVVQKKKDGPKKIVKSSNNAETTRKASKGGTDSEKAMSKLRETGSTDDAADAFLARWKSSEE